jgi:hypothetical protein
MKIEDAKRNRHSCVYCLEFPNGKKYIGKTKNLSKRMGLYERLSKGNKDLSLAIKEFGWENIDIKVLSQVQCSNDIDLDVCLSILEVKYIRDLNTLHPNGYNKSIGGECLGIPIEDITTDSDVVRRYNKGEKAILLYDENGDFVKEYPSIANCAYDNGWETDAIRCNIGKHRLFLGKYFIREKRYDYAPQKIELPKGYEVKERVRYKNIVHEVIIEKEREVIVCTKALKYDMNGKFCGEYNSKNDAMRSFTTSKNIRWGQYFNGYILFKKKDDNYPMEIEPYDVLCNKVLQDYYVPANELQDIEIHKDWDTKFKHSPNIAPLCVNGKYTNIKHKFKVYQCSLSGQIIAEFDSIRDASLETNIPYSQIYNCLKGRTKKAKGYKWKCDDIDKI